MSGKKLSGRQLYWMVLEKQIASHMTLRLDNVKEIKEAIETLLKEDPFMDKQPPSMKSDEIIAYMIGESWIKKVIESLQSQEPLWLRVDPDVERFLDYMYEKLHHVCLYSFTLTASELTVHKLFFYYEAMIRQAHQAYVPRAH